MGSEDEIANKRHEYLEKYFLKDLEQFFRETDRELSERPVTQPVVTYDWLQLSLSARVGLKSEDGTPIEFHLEFVNASDTSHDFPVDMRHWKNSHPCHLLFRTIGGEKVRPTCWGHASIVGQTRERAPLLPGDHVSVSISSVFTPDKILEFPIVSYDLSKYDSVNYLYHYGGTYSAVKTLDLPTA